MKPLKLKGFINNTSTNKDIGAVVFAISFYIVGTKLAQLLFCSSITTDKDLVSGAVLISFGIGIIAGIGGTALYLAVLKPYFKEREDDYEYGKSPLNGIIIAVLIIGLFVGWGIDIITAWNEFM